MPQVPPLLSLPGLLARSLERQYALGKDFTDALTAHSSRSVGAKKPGQGAGEGVGVAVCASAPVLLLSWGPGSAPWFCRRGGGELLALCRAGLQGLGQPHPGISWREEGWHTRPFLPAAVVQAPPRRPTCRFPRKEALSTVAESA